MKPKISLCAAAARPKFWKRLYDSLSGNLVPWELVFVGPNKPDFDLPGNFRFYQSEVKPAQAYQYALSVAEGELLGWMADDCVYNDPIACCSNPLDLMWKAHEFFKQEYQDNKTILSQCSLEDYGMRWDRDRALAFWNSHRFFNGNTRTPVMAPIGFISANWFKEIGGYDRNFVAGQSENDIVMRTIEAGGRVELVPESVICIKHRECHATDRYNFSKGYGQDRMYLQSCWTQNGQMVTKRLRSFQPFEDKDLLTINQGPEGRWAKVAV